MTIRFHIHLIVKRAKLVVLLDLGATKNFMNLSYAKWLQLPIKQLAEKRTCPQVDGLVPASAL